MKKFDFSLWVQIRLDNGDLLVAQTNGTNLLTFPVMLKWAVHSDGSRHDLTQHFVPVAVQDGEGIVVNDAHVSWSVPFTKMDLERRAEIEDALNNIFAKYLNKEET